MKKLCYYISEYMAVLVLAGALLALAFPRVLQPIPTKAINYMLGVVMFGMGLTLNLHDFKIVFSRPKDIIIGCLAQFTVMPLLAWGLSRAFQLDEALALGVVLVGCCPGGTASNVITYLAKGDLALSVGMTGVSTILAPLLTPLLTWALAGKSIHVDVVGMLLSILLVVIMPIVLGLVVKSLWPRFTDKAKDYLPAFSSVAIAFTVAIVISASASKLLAGGLVIVVVVMLHNLCGLGLGYLIGRLLGLADPKRRAISIEVGMQNSGLASSLATLHFAAYPMATIPGAIFSVWHNISGAMVAWLYTRRRTIRPARSSDMTAILQVMDAARQIMRASGNRHQWVNGYPSEAVIAADMAQQVGYVLEEAGRIVAYFAFIPSPEPTYAQIVGGRWLDDEQPYHVIHRMGSYPEVHHVFDDIMAYAFAHDPNIRIDTHRDNTIMQHNLRRHGFTYCGIIYLASGDERLAYQKIDNLSENLDNLS